MNDAANDSCDDDPSPEDLRQIAADLPRAAVGRLSLYHRELHRVLAGGTTSINSREMGKLVDVSPAVVRRDLSSLGSVGRRGVGYDVADLADRIGMLLGSGVRWKVILVGVGSLGDALLRYRGFDQLGFHLAVAFDIDPAKIGRKLGGIRVADFNMLEGVCASIQPDLGILAVPVDAAPEVASKLVGVGVTGILNFTPMTIKLPSSVAVINVDLARELQRLAFAVHANR
ncbi:redox-sensing transcriptional repressor Rex [Crateriforma conspicua]|uniref:Redox-sensing transcriptional repressor Rex n=1 Tax=Crateriforma conspicua TaxID=2527996 RepID=A0A5C5XWS9_9PLAN|nr:redox-sensing transcriptional repressor Rex [Crateriforma conspicua]QDV63392.1 Redox-sensing transcriptional repressor Rex [Crateriforma conspicua]TWT67836.1 Redox-sensing transcriptional repressor Rex [Crateriforma conspicua]